MSVGIVIKGGGILIKDSAIAASDDPCACCIPPCGTSAGSGGAGVTVNTYIYPEQEGEVEFFYEAYTVPDAFKVEGGGQVFVDTGDVSGSATIRFCKPAGLKEIKVTVSGPSRTAWTYTIGCPDKPCSGGTSITPGVSALDHEPSPSELANEVSRLNARNANPLP